MRVDEISPEDFYRQPKEASMTDKIDTSTLGRMDLASGGSPTPIEECVSTWAVDDLIERLRREASLSRGQGDFVMTRHAYLLTEAADRIQSLIAESERLREAARDRELELLCKIEALVIERETLRAALSHKDMT